MADPAPDGGRPALLEASTIGALLSLTIIAIAGPRCRDAVRNGGNLEEIVAGLKDVRALGEDGVAGAAGAHEVVDHEPDGFGRSDQREHAGHAVWGLPDACHARTLATPAARGSPGPRESHSHSGHLWGHKPRRLASGGPSRGKPVPGRPGGRGGHPASVHDPGAGRGDRLRRATWKA